jgi:hypothetical protein
MPAPRVDVDRVPTTGMPREVAALVDEARGLRDKLRTASEQLASAEAKLEQARQDDAQAASERIRKGSTLGAEAPAVEKARQVVEQAKRTERALELANGAALVDLASAIRAASGGWLVALDAEQAKARDHARDALETFEQALAAMRDVAASAGWIRGALEDDRYDRPARLPLLGSAAPSSSRQTSNNEPLNAGELLGYCRELLELPAPPPVAIIEPATSDTT